LEENRYHIDQLFRNSIESETEIPPAEVWNKLKAELDADDARNYKKKFLRAKRIVLILTILLLGLFVFDISRNNNVLTGISERYKENRVDNFQKGPPSVYQSQSKRAGIVKTDRIHSDRKQGVLLTKKLFSDISIGRTTEQYEVWAPPIPEKNKKPLGKSASGDSSVQSSLHSFHFKPFVDIVGFGSAVWAKYVLQDNPGSIRSAIMDRENSELSFNAGILLSWHYKKKFAIQSGLIYNDNYITIQPQTLYASADQSGDIGYKLVTSSGFGFLKPGISNPAALGDSLSTTSIQHHFKYISIPVLLKYKIPFHRLDISAGLGFSLNMLTSSSVQTELESSTAIEKVIISHLQGTRFLHIGLLANAEIKYAVNPKWSVDFIPSISYALTPVNRSRVIQTHPFNMGLGIGMSYRIN
jgi:hypothetical protein